MRILGINNSYPPVVKGGYGEICADVMEGLASRGHEVTMLVCGEQFAPLPAHDAPHVRRRLSYVLGAWRRPAAGIRAALRDDRTVLDELDRSVDAVLAWHCRGISKTVLRRCEDAGVPILYFLHDRWLLYERPGALLVPWSRLDRLGAQLPREVLGRAFAPRRELRAPRAAHHGILCFVSEWLRQEHHRSGLIGAHEEIVPCGVSLARFSRPDPVSIPPTRLLFAGRIEPRKGLHVAIEALAEVPGMTLTVAGPVDDQAYLEQAMGRARELGIAERVDLVGEVARESVRSLLFENDVLIFPSIGVEAYALGLLEAMAAGALVVTSAPGGPREYLRHEDNALLHPPGDAAGLADALHRLVSDPALCQLLLAGAQRTAREHDLERILARTEGLLACATSG